MPKVLHELPWLLTIQLLDLPPPALHGANTAAYAALNEAQLTSSHCGSASAMSRHGSVASLVDAAGPPAGGAPQGLVEQTALTERTWSAPGHIDVALQQQLEPRSSELGAVGATGAGSRAAAVESNASSVGHSPGATA